MKVKDMPVCSECGSKPQRTTICINMWLHDADCLIYQCPNKKCSWHLSPYFYYEKRDKWAKTHKIQDKYVEEYVSAKSGPYDEGFVGEREHWTKYHKMKIKPAKPQDNTLDKVEPKPQKAELDAIAQLEL